MTKQQAIIEFKESILPWVRGKYEKDGTPDKPARREAGNDWVDSLRRAERITPRQYDRWTNPIP